MADQIQALRSSVIGQLQLALPPDTVDNVTQRTPLESVTHVESVMTETMFGAAEYRHQFTTSDPSFVYTYIRLASSMPTPKVFFRMGSVQPEGFWYPWQEHILTSHATEPIGHAEAAGHRLAIGSFDDIWAMERASKTVARRGKISAIVAAIAAENGIENTVIEETDGEGVYIQSFESDAEFIRNRLISRSINKKGFGGYFFFFRDGALHFHTIDYFAGVKAFDYYTNNHALLVNNDRSQLLFDDGIAGVRMVAVDPYTAQVKEVPSSPDAAPRLSEVLYPTSSVSGGALNIPYHLGPNPPSELGAMAQFHYSMARLRTFDLTLTFYGLGDIRIGDVLNLTVQHENRAASPFSGLYLVTQAVYKIHDKTLATTLSLSRGETARLLTSTLVSAASTGLVLPASGQNQSVPSLTAPGRPLNLNALGASNLTTGAENATSRTVIKEVRDAQNG